MRIREPKTTALIFASGKMVVTGAKSEDDSRLASRKYARIIQKLGFNAKFTDFKIQNIVGSCDIKFPIRLEGLASRHHNFSSYEPELFPGLIYRMMKPKIVLLIFVSGKIVLTGAKVREEIYQAFEMIYPVLQGIYSILVSIFVANTSRLQKGLKHSFQHAPLPTLLVNYTHSRHMYNYIRIHETRDTKAISTGDDPHTPRVVIFLVDLEVTRLSILAFLHCIGVFKSCSPVCTYSRSRLSLQIAWTFSQKRF